MTHNPRIDGGGPWLPPFPMDVLSPGDTAIFDLRSMEYEGQKRFFDRWLPMDQVMFKNLDSANQVQLDINGIYGAVVEPNAADTFDDAGVTRVAVTNIGGSDISTDDLVIQFSVEPHGADDAARAEVHRSPVENFVRGVFNQ